MFPLLLAVCRFQSEDRLEEPFQVHLIAFAVSAVFEVSSAICVVSEIFSEPFPEPLLELLFRFLLNILLSG